MLNIKKRHRSCRVMAFSLIYRLSESLTESHQTAIIYSSQHKGKQNVLQKHCYWFVKALLLHRKSIEIATQKHCYYNTTRQLIDSNPSPLLFNSRIIRRKSKANTIKKRYYFDLILFSFPLLIPSFCNEKHHKNNKKIPFFSTPTSPFSSQ